MTTLVLCLPVMQVFLGWKILCVCVYFFLTQHIWGSWARHGLTFWCSVKCWDTVGQMLCGLHNKTDAFIFFFLFVLFFFFFPCVVCVCVPFLWGSQKQKPLQATVEVWKGVKMNLPFCPLSPSSCIPFSPVVFCFHLVAWTPKGNPLSQL